MREFFEAAVANVYRHGDTDIFPFPAENRILHDEKVKTVDLLMTARSNFESQFAQELPNDLKELVPVGRNGFRTAMQLDPLWNALLSGPRVVGGRKDRGRQSSK